MNSIQENKLSMYYVLRSTCDKYQSTWVTNAVFAATYNLWLGKLPLIEQNRDAQIIETSGITTDKSDKRAAMVEKALFIVSRLQSYANTTSNVELNAGVSYTQSDLRKSRDGDLVGICNSIVTKATANAANIVNYGVTAAMITELQGAIIAFSATLPKPKAAKSQTKTATENLRILFKEADLLLTKRLDLDIEMFKTTKPDFYSQYKTARYYTSIGRKVMALTGKVTMAEVGGPIKGVTFTFTPQLNGLARDAGTDTVKTIVKKSADKGNFRIANLQEGTYQVVVRKIGFKEQVLTVNVANGETTKLKVELEKN